MRGGQLTLASFNGGINTVVNRFAIVVATALLGAWAGTLATSLFTLASDQALMAQLIVSLTTFCGALVGWRACHRSAVRLKHNGVAMLVLLAVTFLFRVNNLGWSEFQGDEARAMLAAEALTQGDTAPLFTHRKGPGEILTAASAISLSRSTDEFAARLPFALASIASFAALTICIGVLFNPLIGFAALLLVLQDGVLLGFARIVQYQSPMLLFGLAAWQLILAGAWRSSWVLLGALLGATLLCHYDGIFLVAPAIIYIAVQGFRDNSLLKSGAPVSLVCVLLAGLFYIPFFLAPDFATTAQYLSQRAASVPLPTFNLPRWFNTWSIYSGTVATFSVLGLLVVAIALLPRREKLLAVTICAVALSLIALGLLQPWLWFALVLSAGALALRLSANPIRSLFLVALVPVMLFGFWFAKPNTHFLIATPALIAILVAPLAALSRVKLNLFLAALCLAMIAALPHQYELFLDEGTSRPRLRSSVVEFGFSHRTGLKTAANLLAERGLTGAVVTNDDPLVANWYLRRHTTSRVRPEFAIVIERGREPQSTSVDKDDYQLFARVMLKGRKAADIFRLRAAMPEGFQPSRVPAD